MKRIEDTASAKFLLLDIKPGNMLARPYDASHIDGTNTWDAASWGTATDIRQTDFGVGAHGRVRAVTAVDLLSPPPGADFAAYLPDWSADDFDEKCMTLIMMTQLEGVLLSCHGTTGASPFTQPSSSNLAPDPSPPLTHSSPTHRPCLFVCRPVARLNTALLGDVLTMTQKPELRKCVTAIEKSTQASSPTVRDQQSR